MIRETCSCGASFEAQALMDREERLVTAWRENHRHDKGCAATFPTDDRIVTLDVHDDPCDCDVCKTAWVKELKRRITNPGQSAEHPLDSPQNAPLSGNPDTPPSAENPYNPCDCWRCDDSCQNSTENGTVVTANADNPVDDGERRQDEPPAGTPVWWDGEWWCKSTSTIYPEFYYAVAGRAASRMWHEMPGAVAALAPEQVDAYCVNSKQLGKLEGMKAGREDAAKAVEALTMVVAVNGTLMVRRGEAANAARGDKP